MPETVSPRSRPSTRGRAAWLLVPLTLSWVGIALGTAFAPVLLERAPLVLIALAPLPRHLVLAQAAIAPAPFYAVALVRSFVVDPFMYVLGRDYGEPAVVRFAARFASTAWALNLLIRIFRRAGHLALFLSPDPFMSLLAGTSGMRPWGFVTVNLAGTAASLVFYRYVGARFADAFAVVRALISTNMVWATLLSIAIVLAAVVRQIVRAKGGEPD